MASSDNGVVGGEDGQKYRFTVLADGIVRMEWAPDGVFEDRLSIFAAHRDKAKIPKYKVKDSGSLLEIITDRFHLTYNKKEFSAHGLYALVSTFTRSLWRFKEAGQPNLGGTYRTLDGANGDVNQGNGVKIELEEGILSPRGYALLDDSKSMLLEPNGFIAPRRPGDGRIDAYLFAYGHDYRDAIKAYYSISGPTPMLPRWALGNWWSRYYEYTTESYLTLMDRFRSEGIPLSVGVIDMDWHLVDDPKVIEAGQTGWTGYTWNKNLFPDPPAFLKELHKRNLQVSLNDHPADGIHSYEDIYCKAAKALGHDTSSNEPIVFDCVDPKFLKVYFDVVLKSLEDDGCDFWWIDWQQGPFSLFKDVDPLWVLNHFHFEHIAKKDETKRPIIFSRYAGPGSHRYPVGFSGDTVTSWDSLHFQPEFTATASNIGYGWWSHDIGGHMMGVMDDELTVRWIQFGVMSPVMRLHSTKNRWVAKEPWKLSAETGAVITKFLRLRHRLIPYLQTMNVRASLKGEPLIQPMYWEYSELDEAYQFKNQYLFGTEMLVVPITTPSDPALKLGRVKGWLPAGTYVDWFTGVVYEGDRELWLSRTQENYPVFLRKGSIVPLDSSAEPENGAPNPDGFEVVVAVGADGHFDILEEPESHGETTQPTEEAHFDCIPISFKQETGTLQINSLSHGKGSATNTRKSRKWSVRFLGLSDDCEIQVSVGDSSVKPKVTSEANGIVVELGDISSSSSATIKLGADPQLRRNDPLKLVEPIVRRAQIEYNTKDKVWEALTDEKVPISVRVSRLQTTDMNPNLRLFLTENMLADSRH